MIARLNLTTIKDLEKTRFIPHRPWRVHGTPRPHSRVAKRETAWPLDGQGWGAYCFTGSLFVGELKSEEQESRRREGKAGSLKRSGM